MFRNAIIACASYGPAGQLQTYVSRVSSALVRVTRESLVSASGYRIVTPWRRKNQREGLCEIFKLSFTLGHGTLADHYV